MSPKRSPRRANVYLKRWSRALVQARNELGITEFVRVKKNASPKSIERRLYKTTMAIYTKLTRSRQ